MNGEELFEDSLYLRAKAAKEAKEDKRAPNKTDGAGERRLFTTPKGAGQRHTQAVPGQGGAERSVIDTGRDFFAAEMAREPAPPVPVRDRPLHALDPRAYADMRGVDPLSDEFRDWAADKEPALVGATVAVIRAQQYAQQQADELLERIPSWRDPEIAEREYRALQAYAKTKGVSEEQLSAMEAQPDAGIITRWYETWKAEQLADAAGTLKRRGWASDAGEVFEKSGVLDDVSERVQFVRPGTAEYKERMKDLRAAGRFDAVAEAGRVFESLLPDDEVGGDDTERSLL
jgi:hypothetical protein